MKKLQDVVIIHNANDNLIFKYSLPFVGKISSEWSLDGEVHMKENLWGKKQKYLASELFEHPQGQPLGIFECSVSRSVVSISFRGSATSRSNTRRAPLGPCEHPYLASERAVRTPGGGPVDLRTPHRGHHLMK